MATFTIPGRGTVSQQEFESYWNNVFRTDPEMQSIFAKEKAKKGKVSEGQREQAATQRAMAMGWQPPDQDWSVDYDKGGFRTERANAFTRNKDWLIPAIVGGATLGIGAAGAGPAAGLFGGGGGAAAGGAAAVPSMAGIPISSGVPAGLIGGASAPSIAGGMTAPAIGAGAATGGGRSGILGKLFGAGSKVADVAGAASAGRAEGRAGEAQYLLDRDRLEQSRVNQGNQNQFGLAGLDLNQRQFGLGADRERLSQATKLGLLGGLQDVNIATPSHITPHVGTVTGGARPSAIANRQQIVSAMQPRILEKLMTGEQFTPPKLEEIPGLSTPPQPSGVDRFLNTAGTVGTIFDLAAPFFGGGPQQQAPITSIPAPATIASGYGRPGAFSRMGLRYGGR